MPSIAPDAIAGPQITAKDITVIEPHSDDAFLSLGTHIAEWVREGIQVTIITVFSGTRNRGLEAATYAEAVGARWEGWGFVEGAPLPSACGTPTAPPRINPRTQLILPLSLTNNEHHDVRNWLDCPGCWYYLDQPYAITQRTSKFATQQMQGRRIVSYRKPSLNKYRHIEIFKDQGKFFYFNPVEKLRETFELIIE